MRLISIILPLGLSTILAFGMLGCKEQSSTTVQKTHSNTALVAQQAAAKPLTVKPIEITLYSDKNLKSKVIDTFTLPNENYVGFFSVDDWLKVYNKHDGATYWINQSQLHDAQKAYHMAQQAKWQQEMQLHKPQSTYIYIEKKQRKDAKPETKIIAYENGKALSDKDAKALYNNMQDNQSTLDSQFKAMHKQFVEQEYKMEQMFRPFAHHLYVPVFIEQQKKKMPAAKKTRDPEQES